MIFYLDVDLINVLVLSSRGDAVTACLELTNTPVYGNVIYVSAKDSIITEFKVSFYLIFSRASLYNNI